MPHRLPTLALQFVVLFALWMLLAGRTLPRDFVIGALVVLYIVFINRHLIKPPATNRLGQPTRLNWGALLFSYLPWLIWQIILANIEVAKIIVFRKPINPKVLTFKTGLRNETAITLFANSITLTPGTLSVDVVGDTLYVHALDPDLAGGIFDGDIEARVARVFNEAPITPDVDVTTAFPKTEAGDR